VPASPTLKTAKSGGKLLWWRRAGPRKDNQKSSRPVWDGLDDRTECHNQRTTAKHTQHNERQNGEIPSQGPNTFPPPGLKAITHGITPIDELPEYDNGDSDGVVVVKQSSQGSGSISSRSKELSRGSPPLKAKMAKSAEGERGKQDDGSKDNSWSDLVESFAQKMGLFAGWFRKKNKAQYGVDRKC
jgi:hypothetical protein